MMKHQPVLLKEFLEYFEKTKLTVFFDGTLGAGGHAKAILENHPEIELFIGCDQDPMALEIAETNLEPWKNKIKLIQGNFSKLDSYLDREKITCLNGCFFDVGVSSMQLDNASRGFSFQKEGPLDMRMDPSLKISAADVVNTFSQKELEKIFKELGEEPNWKFLARQIVEKRKKTPVVTTTQFVEMIIPAIRRKKPKLHPATLAFQALRIFVNKELEVLEKGVKHAMHRLCKEGRMGVISFHRLEDRIVKNVFRDAARKTVGEVMLLTKKPLVATREETRINPRSRSAKMRFVEKIRDIRKDDE